MPFSIFSECRGVPLWLPSCAYLFPCQDIKEMRRSHLGTRVSLPGVVNSPARGSLPLLTQVIQYGIIMLPIWSDRDRTHAHAEGGWVLTVAL